MTKLSPRHIALPLLVVATIAVYAPVARHEFVGLDDGAYIFENDRVLAGLSAESAGWAFRTTRASNWHPLTWLSHMLDVQLFGPDPHAHHLVNLLFHLANTVLLFLVFARMTGTFWRSAAVAALFALHPLHVESVAWVAERKDVLSTFFGLLSLWLYVRYVEAPGAARYLLVLLAFALGLMAKPMLVTLPFVLLLLDYWPLGRPTSDWQRLVLEKAPFLVLSAASSVVTVYAQSSGAAIITMESLPLGLRIGNALISYVSYLGQTLWPHALAVYYPHPGELWPLGAVAAALLLVGLSVLALRAGRSRGYAALGWFWYLGTLVPVIGLVQVGEQAMADRYTYLPLIGLFVVLAWGVPDLVRSRRLPHVLLPIGGGVVLLALSVQTWIQVGYWKSTETLFQHTLSVTRDNSTAHAALAGAYFHEGRLEEAIAQYREALEIDPEYARAHHNLGVALERQGHRTEALAQHMEAVRIQPDYATYQLGLATALHRSGRVEEAIPRYEKALLLDPERAGTFNNLGVARMGRGELEQAVRAFTQALELRPAYTEAHYNLGYTYSLLGQLEPAVEHYEAALRLQPEDAETHFDLAEALQGLGQLDRAIEHYSEALRIDPEYPGAETRLRSLTTQDSARRP